MGSISGLGPAAMPRQLYLQPHGPPVTQALPAAMEDRPQIELQLIDHGSYAAARRRRRLRKRLALLSLLFVTVLLIAGIVLAVAYL